MMKSTLLLLAGFSLALTGSLGCGDNATTTNGNGVGEFVEPGKSDNYLSPTSREYALTGVGKISLAADTWEQATTTDREAHVNEVLALRFKAYSHFINEYVTDKSSHDENKDYGGFGGLIHGSSLEFIVVPVDLAELEWEFLYELELGGPSNLLGLLPLTKNGDDENVFKVTVPVLSESMLRSESYPRHFDPAVWDGEVTEIEVAIAPKAESIDGYPEFNRLASDGVIDIMIVVGGDYNDKRYDLLSAASHFKWLKEAGFASELTEYTQLALDSKPFTKTLDMDGDPVRLEITLLYPDIVEDADLDELRDVIIGGYQTHDIVIYDGHAGQDPDYSGVVYHYKPRHAISATKLGDLSLPTKYQIFVFNGCKTYGVYPESVYKNDTKTFENLDIVSTVNFSWLSQQTFTTSGLLSELFATPEKTHDPRTWREVLTEINRKNNANVYYGVHGIDDNPHLNPYADIAELCSPCKANADCSGAGNICVGFSSGFGCGAECTSDDGCPGGYQCGEIAVDGQISERQCVPNTFRCQQ
ncbi:MAG: hypothetical protein ACI9MR_001057 [Myxococcota bacterium]|jgi:hypothetical protein